MNLTNGIIIAFVAGLASAMLGAAAMTGPGLGLFFVIVAPLPLIIVGLRWHPLLALLGGALTAAALAFFLRSSAAVTFSVLVTLPAYCGSALFWWSKREEGPVAGVMCLLAAAIAVIVTLAGCLSISFSYTELEAQLLRQSEMVYRFMMGIPRDGALVGPGGQDPQVFIRAYANAVAPLSCAMLTAIYIVNFWLAARIAHKSLPGLFDWEPVYMMRLPSLLLPLSAGALLGGLLPGYIGLALELVGFASMICLMALGYAAAHHATVGIAARASRSRPSGWPPFSSDCRRSSCSSQASPRSPSAGGTAFSPAATPETAIKTKEHHHGSHSSGARRQARPDGRSRECEAGLRP